jgi:hypothetical protein
MVVKIRFQYGPRASTSGRKNRRIALAIAALLTPAALTACALALWRLAADVHMAGPFAISYGLFSHWQVWFALAIVIQLIAILLNRFGGGQSVVETAGEESSEPVLDRLLTVRSGTLRSR